MSSYYGPETPTTISFLEFGSIDLVAGKKSVWDFQLHEKAYDWLMLARYANDMVTYLRLKDMEGKHPLGALAELYKKEIHHPNDASGNLSKLIALTAVQNKIKPTAPLSFFELGQTIFGCIEGMEFYLSLLNASGLNDLAISLKKVEWFGMDISSFFNTLCSLMHQEYSVQATDRVESFHYPKDVFFAKGVTLLYACQNAEELLKNLNRGRISVFDYSFAMHQEEKTSIGTGKQVVYPPLEHFKKLYQNSGKSFYVRANKSKYNPQNDRLWVDGVYGEPPLVQEFIRLDTQVRTHLKSKWSGLGAMVFLDLSPEEKIEWIPFETFIEQGHYVL